MRRQQEQGRVSHERWLVSYADFITLMFAFFVVLYASAQVDQKKVVRLASAIEAAFQQLGIFQTEGRRPPLDPAHLPPQLSPNDPALALSRIAPVSGAQESEHQKMDFAAIRAELEKALAPEITRREVALRSEPDGLVVSLREIGFFDSGSAEIKPGARNAFGRVAEVLQEHACAVRIEGHTDTVPIHTAQFASNWELSTARATEIVKLLVEQYRFPAERLSAAGYAEFHPVADNATAEGRQLNRRVDVVIVPAPLRSTLLKQPQHDFGVQENRRPLARNLEPSGKTKVTP